MKNPASFYIHIPYCVSKCKYCDFFSIENKNTFIPQEYVDALCKEIEYRKREFNITSIKTVYIGGGTPSLLNENQLSQICTKLFINTEITDNFEFTIEVNPDDVSVDLLKSFAKNQINRISCGIQSLNDECLKFSGRRASLRENIKALEILKNNWKGDLSLDLICGLPEESETSFIEGLKTICSYNPAHISMYSLTFEEETPFGKLLETGKLDYNFDKSDDLWLKGKSILEENGYIHYEVSNFCKDGKECSHNLVYWNHQDYIGIGSGGTGTVYKENGTGKRWSNKNNLLKYINYWNKENTENLPEDVETIDLETSKFEFFMMGLRKVSGISENHYKKLFGEQIPAEIIHIFEKYKKNNRAEIIKTKDDTVYTLGKNGILFLNAFLEEII